MNEILQQLIPLARPAAYLLTLIAFGLFFAYRQDYKGHPERTVIAVKLTLSTMRKILSLGLWKQAPKPPVEPPDEPRERRVAEEPRRRPTPTDMGTISRPIPAVPPPTRED